MSLAALIALRGDTTRVYRRNHAAAPAGWCSTKTLGWAFTRLELCVLSLLTALQVSDLKPPEKWQID